MLALLAEPITWTQLLQDPATWGALLTLTAMEIVLGIDNIVFISILCGRLPEEKQLPARRIGLAVALVARLVLLFAIGWVMQLDATLFEMVVPVTGAHLDFSGRDLILLAGGVFLVGKATHEIYENVEHPGHDRSEVASEARAVAPDLKSEREERDLKKLFISIIFQILLLDLVFSIDSVITAVGMADHISIMATAIIIAIGVMLVFAGPIGDFVQKTPSIRILALAFLILIGVMLVADGMGSHMSKGYIYSAMGFSLAVELINIRMRKKRAEARSE